MGENDVVISTRIPKQTLVQIKKSVGKEYVNEADFVRSAIRSELFRQKISEIKKELSKTQDSPNAVRKLRDLLKRVAEDDYEKWIQEEAKDMI